MGASGRVNSTLQEVFRLINETTKHEDETTLQFSPASSALTEPNAPLQLITKHGLQRTISMRETPIRDHSSHLMGTVIVFHDITDQHRHQDEQQRISKLNSLRSIGRGALPMTSTICSQRFLVMSLSQNCGWFPKTL